MSAAELIERYGFSGCEAGFIMFDMERAQSANRAAANARMAFPNPGRRPTAYVDLMGEQLFLEYRGQARSYGWLMARLIDQVVREEEAGAARQVEAGEWSFTEPACSEETCDDCERPLWHHIQRTDGTRLCPLGRRFWQVARALCSDVYEPGPSNDREFLSLIARRP